MRLLLAAMITLSAYVFGCGIASRQGDACRCIKDIIRLCEYIECRISFSAMPLRALLLGSGTEFGTAAARDGWNEAASALPVPAECIHELKQFGNTLGITEFDVQLRAVKGLKEYLEQQYQILNGTLKSRQKSTRAVCGLAGALAGLLLI